MSAPEPTAAPAPSTWSAETVSLVARIVSLQLRQSTLGALTAEALPALLELLHAEAGALLLNRPDDGALALAAARGLSAPGAHLLDTLHWGDTGTWQMPVHALLGRKVLLVDGPSDDPTVAELIEGTFITLAAIPLYRWRLPVGVVLAIARVRPMLEADILSHIPAYDVLALALSAFSNRGHEQGSDTAGLNEPPPPLFCERWVDPNQIGQSEADRLAAERNAFNEREAAAEQHRVVGRDALTEILRELHATVAALEEDRHAAAAERASLAERLTSAEEARAELLARIDTLEMHTERIAQASLAMAAAPVPPANPQSLAAPPPSSADESGNTGEVFPAPAPPVEVAPAQSEPTPESIASAAASPSRVFEPDEALRERIAAALEKTAGTRRPGLIVTNLHASATIREAHVPILAYAADGNGQSRILGAIHCFTNPPTAEETGLLLESVPRGAKRVITLSSDVDAFLPAKAALAKAGHSVSMACDENQALDLLAILRPDVVFVDLRTAPEPAAEFLDALGPETGRTLLVLVCGSNESNALPRTVARLLRPTPLDPAELARVGRQWVAEGGR